MSYDRYCASSDRRRAWLAVTLLRRNNTLPTKARELTREEAEQLTAEDFDNCPHKE